MCVKDIKNYSIIKYNISIMEFEKPQKKGFTVYCKSGCKNCLKVKMFLLYHHKKFVSVDCDEYLIEDRENFIIFLQKITGIYKQFPLVFYDGKFIGEYLETVKYCNEFIDFDESF